MKLFKTITRPPWRTLLIFIMLAGLLAPGYNIWTPGSIVLDGSHDVKTTGKILCIAAYSPPTLYQQTLDVSWEKTYYAEVARGVDQMAIIRESPSTVIGRWTPLNGITYRHIFQKNRKG